MMAKGKPSAPRARHCGFCGKMSERGGVAQGAFICEPCIRRFLGTGSPSSRADVRCAWCGKASEGGRTLFEGLPPLKARSAGIGLAVLSGPTGQLAICSECLTRARDAA